MTPRGFTLLEVLVAVVIVTLAFVALMTSTIQVLGNHATIQQKTLALWVGDNVMQQWHAHIFIDAKETMGEMAMGHQSFVWRLELSQAQDKPFQYARLSIENDQQPLISLNGVVHENR